MTMLLSYRGYISIYSIQHDSLVVLSRECIPLQSTVSSSCQTDRETWTTEIYHGSTYIFRLVSI